MNFPSGVPGKTGIIWVTAVSGSGTWTKCLVKNDCCINSLDGQRKAILEFTPENTRIFVNVLQMKSDPESCSVEK